MSNRIALDAYIDGVETVCKSAGVNDAQRAAVWGVVASAMQKSAEGKTDPFGAGLNWLRKNWALPGVGGVGRTIGYSLVPGLLTGGLGGLMYTGLRRYRKDESRPWLRNMIMGSLLGTAAAPYWMKHVDKNWLTPKSPAGATGQ